MTTTLDTPAAPIAMITPDPESDALRRRGLRRMRTLAVSLLVFAAVVYLVTLGQGGFWGYVNAGAEASMVGAIADWFAVTALFKHPLGLPVPHTALIPQRKDELGRSLEQFVGENFLQEAIIRDRVATAQVSLRAGQWLAEPSHVRRVVDEVAEVASIGLGKVRDDHVADFVTEAIIPRFREEPVAPLAGSLLAEVVHDDLHHGLVDLAVDELHDWLVENPDTFAEVLVQRAPWWTPDRLNSAVTRRIHTEVVAWLAEIRADPRHRARAGVRLDARPAGRGPAPRPRHPGPHRAAQGAPPRPPAGRRVERRALERLPPRPPDVPRRPRGRRPGRLATELASFGEQLRVRRGAAGASGRHGRRRGRVLRGPLRRRAHRGDHRTRSSAGTARRPSRRIELHVGRDLQFIRINGTIVGGLVGVLIHAVSMVVR